MHGDIIVKFNIDPLKIAGPIWSQKYPPFTAGIISVLYLRWPCFHCEGNPAETTREKRKTKATGQGGGKVNKISRKCSSNLNTNLVLSRRYLAYIYVSYFFIYIFLEPVCPLFLVLNLPKESHFHSKQGSFWRVWDGLDIAPFVRIGWIMPDYQDISSVISPFIASRGPVFAGLRWMSLLWGNKNMTLEIIAMVIHMWCSRGTYSRPCWISGFHAFNSWLLPIGVCVGWWCSKSLASKFGVQSSGIEFKIFNVKQKIFIHSK